jgi:polyphosphate kinase
MGDDEDMTSVSDRSRGAGEPGDADGAALLLDPNDAANTWREGYPYDHKMTRREYEEFKRSLQIELLKLQSWVK